MILNIQKIRVAKKKYETIAQYVLYIDKKTPIKNGII